MKTSAFYLSFIELHKTNKFFILYLPHMMPDDKVVSYIRVPTQPLSRSPRDTASHFPDHVAVKITAFGRVHVDGPTASNGVERWQNNISEEDHPELVCRICMRY